jgi:hypothetical protein
MTPQRCDDEVAVAVARKAGIYYGQSMPIVAASMESRLGSARGRKVRMISSQPTFDVASVAERGR